MITARQLAEELLKNPDDIVCVTSKNFEMNGATVYMGSTYLYRFNGVTEKMQFRDSFDGTRYKEEVISQDPAGKIQFVKL